MGSSHVGVMSKLPTNNKTIDSSQVITKQNAGAIYDVPFTIEHSFQNGFPYPVSIVFRNGMGFTIPKAVFKWRPCYDFTIFVKYKFSKNVKFDIHHLLDDVNNQEPFVKTLRDAFRQAGTNIIYNGNEAVIAYHVSKKTFEDSKGSLYLEDLDILLCSDQDIQSVRTVHPESEMGKLLLEQRDRVEGYNYRIVINDPNNDYGQRFINICNRIYKISPKTDYGKDPGVYLSYTDDDDNSIEEYYSFEDADQSLMLYKTRSDAKVFGDIIENRKREIEEQHHQYKLRALELEAANASLKSETEKRLAAVKEERARADAEYAKMLTEYKQRELTLQSNIAELENNFAKEKAYRDNHINELKLKYEQRSLDRKDSSEIIKWLPAIVTGGYLVFKKFF